MSQSFFFYDLETSGINPRKDRIMQFAGRRTTIELKPVGEPVNILIKLTDDVLPSPEALLVTGITPQKTIADGISEADFCKLFFSEIAVPDTIFVGFNNIRFDDEFMRFLFWRNFYDAYEWQWKDGCSRWDILDVSRLTRALRPDGIKWPFAADGKPTNKLEYLTSINKLDHQDAHDALSDVDATIAVSKLIKSKQPKLFEYLLNMRAKDCVKGLAMGSKPMVYSSGKYPGEFEKTTVVQPIGLHPDKNGVLVYDLRHDPDEFAHLSVDALIERWRYDPETKEPRLPVKTMKFNRCPAIAPLSVVDSASWQRLGLQPETVTANQKKLASSAGFIEKIFAALDKINIARNQAQSELIVDEKEVDSMLYNGFVGDRDKQTAVKIRGSDLGQLASYQKILQDERLKKLLPLYKARNFPAHLTPDESQAWDNYRFNLLMAGGETSQFATLARRLDILYQSGELRDADRFILDELELWMQSIQP